MTLSSLLSKFSTRKYARRRHLELYKRSHKTKRGFARAAARDGRAMRKLAGLIAKARHAQKGKLSGVRIRSTAPGNPHWGGAADVVGQFITPFMAKRGLPKGSGKRTPAHNAAIGGSSSSDHLTTHTTTFARDYPTFTGEDDARALAAALGNRSWQSNSYDTFDVRIGGHTWRIQILWGSAIGHGDHVHVGVSLVA